MDRQGKGEDELGKFIVRRMFGAGLVTLAGMLALVFFVWRKPLNAEAFKPVHPSKVEFLSHSEDGSFKPSEGVPLVEAALGKPFYAQNFDGAYNKLAMRCRIQILSGLPVQSSLDDYRVLLVTSKAKLLLDLHPLASTTVSEDFVCVRDGGMLSVPGIKKIKMTADDHLKIMLVRRHSNTK